MSLNNLRAFDCLFLQLSHATFKLVELGLQIFEVLPLEARRISKSDNCIADEPYLI